MWPAASTLWTQMLHFAANRKLDSNQEMTRRWARGLRTTLQTIGKAVMDRGCLRGDTAGVLRERRSVKLGVFLYIFALSVASYPVLRNWTALVGGGEEVEEVEMPSSKGV